MDEKKALEENEKIVAPLSKEETNRRIRIVKRVKKTTLLNKQVADKIKIAKRRAKNKRARLSRKKNRK